MIFIVVERLGWRDDDVIASVDTHCKNIFHVAYNHTVPLVIAHYLVLNLLPVPDITLYQNLMNHAEIKTSLHNFLQFILIVCDTTTPAAQRVRYSDDDRVANVISFLEPLSVFSDVYSSDRGAKNRYAVFLEDALLVQ